MPEGDGVGADAELGTPFFGDGFRKAGDAGFGDGVVGLAAVRMVRLTAGKLRWEERVTEG